MRAKEPESHHARRSQRAIAREGGGGLREVRRRVRARWEGVLEQGEEAGKDKVGG